MDIQSRIAKVLAGTRQGIFEPSVRTNDIGAVEVVGALKGKKKLFSPIKQCQFAVSCSTSPNVILLLKEFDIPAIGMSFSMEEDKLWFPVPRPSVPATTFTGYLWDKSFADTLVEASMYQYRMGLLSTRKGIGFSFYLLEWIDESLTELDTLGQAAKAVQSVISGINGVPSVEFQAAVPDLVEDAAIKAERASWNLLQGGISVTPLLTLKGCRMSPPVIMTSQSSGDLSTVKVDLTYTKARWLDTSQVRFIAPSSPTSDIPVD